MQPKDYFFKTFAFVFVFYIVYKATAQLLTDYSKINLEFIFKNLIIGLIVAAILGVINYFAKVDIPQKKQDKNNK